MRRLELTVNGEARSLVVDEERSLLEVLREDLDLTGTKYGCGEGQCRACTVLLDGRPVTSCRTPVRDAEGAEVTTIEGLAGATLHPVQQAFVDAQAMQCGFCVPGMILSTVGLLRDHPEPSRDQVVRALNGNLCRCGGYVRILDAVDRAAAQAAHAAEGAGR